MSEKQERCKHPFEKAWLASACMCLLKLIGCFLVLKVHKKSIKKKKKVVTVTILLYLLVYEAWACGRTQTAEDTFTVDGIGFWGGPSFLK